MEVGVAVWLRDNHGDKAWIPTNILSKENRDGKVKVTVRNEHTGEILNFILDDENHEIDDLKLRNDDHESQVENLINLPYLHEPAILYSLESRYFHGDIYTYTGPILIALNPFKNVPLYSTQILESYYNVGLLKSQGIDNSGSAPLPPHVYAIADAAYRDMMKIVKESGGGKEGSKVPANQCVLISGESGAGKTESTKIVLKYLTTVGSSTGSAQLNTGSVMDKILQSNPILEAFGNARTLRNDNSSRFGKFIELNFNKRGVLIGGRIRTYLLEKVRLPCQQLGERNFHVFYQMAVGGTEEEKAEWCMLPLQETWYTSQGDIYELRHIDDADEYRKMRAALKTLNFVPEHQTALFRIMAGLLHLGQLQFQSDSSGEGSVVSNDAEVQRSLQTVANLLCVPVAELQTSLTRRVITARNETVVKNLNPVQASDARDAVARAIYGRIFDWIVRTINTSIEVDLAGVRADIGVLDIFGFECFKHNSFEQLCINYTNETLQQQFNQFVFKLEQKEYEAEKIQWSFISFPDNQDCLDLIEHKQKGLLAMLDDECRLPGASDEKYASRLYKSYEGNNRFSATPAQRRDSMFCIRHYAGVVIYCARTFVEKNKDELPREAETLMLGSSISLLSLVFAAAPNATSNTSSSGGPPKVVSVGSQFKEQLASLMEKIYSTAPHYIRCLKPNDDNAPDTFHRRRTTEQLRYGGVLEAVRVARSGFPVRLTHSDFYSRYRCLANPFNPIVVSGKLPRYLPQPPHHAGEARELCEVLLEALWDDSVPNVDPVKDGKGDGVALGRNRRVSRIMDVSTWKGKLEVPRESLQLGLTKVFLRKAAHDLLEARRSRRLHSCAVRIQALVRSFRLRSQYLTLSWAVRTIQRVVRGTLARVEASKRRYQRSARVVQTCFRRYVARSRYLWVLKSVITLQSLRRRHVACGILSRLKHIARVVRVQRIARGIVVCSRYRRLRRACIALQCRFRRAGAMRELKALKAAAKDMGLLKQSNDALKAEIELLRSRAAEENKKMLERASAAKDAELHRVVAELTEVKDSYAAEVHARQQLQAQVTSYQSQLAAATQRYTVAEETIAALDAELQALRDHGARLQLEVSETEEQVAGAHAALRQAQAENNDLVARLAEAEELLCRDRSSLDQHLALRSKHDGTSATTSKAPTTTHTSLASLAFPSVTPTAPLSTSADSDTHVTHSSSINNGDMEQQLIKERRQREALEEEVARLRHMSVELRAEVETLKRSKTTPGTGAPIPSTASLPRRPDAEPRRKTSLRGSFGSDSNATENAGSNTTNPATTAASSKPPLAPSGAAGGQRKPSAVTGTTKLTHKSARPAAAPVDAATLAAAAALNNFGEDDDESTADISPPQTVTSRSTSNASTAGSHQIRASKRGSASSGDGSGSTIGQQAAAVASTSAAVDMFEKNLEAFRNKLKQGVRAHVWDGARVARAEVTVKLSANADALVFETKRYFFLSAKTDVPQVNIADIYECIQAAEVAESTSTPIDPNTLMTMVIKPAQTNDSRIMALELANAEERNVMLTGIRSLVSQQSMKSLSAHTHTTTQSSSSRNVGAGVGGMRPTVTVASSSSSSATNKHAPASSSSTRTVGAAAHAGRRQSVRDIALEEALNTHMNPSSAASSTPAASGPAGTTSPTIVSGSNPLANARARKASVASGAGGSSRTLQQQHAIHDLTNSQDAEQLLQELTHEREDHERMLVQMMMLTNELNDRDEQIAQLRARESALQTQLAQKEKMWEQDALVRMQLGKKLEQVLMDKEDLQEENEMLHEQLESVRASFALVVEQNAAAAALAASK